MLVDTYIIYNIVLLHRNALHVITISFSVLVEIAAVLHTYAIYIYFQICILEKHVIACNVIHVSNLSYERIFLSCKLFNDL